MSMPAAKQVFISYASADRERADEIVSCLESAGISCWLAPRDIAPGENYADAIMRGIHACADFMILFSEKSDASQHVQREVERAVHLKKRLVPVRLADLVPTGGMDYFLATVHWTDAFLPGWQPVLLAAFGASEARHAPPPQVPVKKRLPLTVALVVIAALTILAALLVWKPADRDWLERLDTATKQELLAVRQDFDLSISAPGGGSPVFKIGDPIHLTLKSAADAHVIVVIHSSDGSELVVFPNSRHPDGRIQAGRPLEVPGPGMELTAAEPAGTDVAFAIASTQAEDLAAFQERLKSQTRNGSYATFASAGIRGAILATSQDKLVSTPAARDGSNSATAPARRASAGMTLNIEP